MAVRLAQLVAQVEPDPSNYLDRLIVNAARRTALTLSAEGLADADLPPPKAPISASGIRHHEEKKMTDDSIVTPEAAELLRLMAEETRLPADWDTSGFWLAHAQQLAQFMADKRGQIMLTEAAMLLGLGGMLVEMAKREREASAEAGRWLRGEGGVA